MARFSIKRWEAAAIALVGLVMATDVLFGGPHASGWHYQGYYIGLAVSLSIFAIGLFLLTYRWR